MIVCYQKEEPRHETNTYREQLKNCCTSSCNGGTCLNEEADEFEQLGKPPIGHRGDTFIKRGSAQCTKLAVSEKEESTLMEPVTRPRYMRNSAVASMLFQSSVALSSKPANPVQGLERKEVRYRRRNSAVASMLFPSLSKAKMSTGPRNESLVGSLKQVNPTAPQTNSPYRFYGQGVKLAPAEAMELAQKLLAETDKERLEEIS